MSGSPTQRIPVVDELPAVRETHLSETELIGLENRTLDADATDELREHLDRCGECRQRLEALHQEDSSGKTRIRDPLIGRPLGEYVVEAALARGGMGVVYRGVQPMIGKPVAIKVLIPEVDDADAINRLLDEARAVNAIRHPNIIDIFSFGSLPDGRHYFVMQLLDGQSLEEVIVARRRLTPEQVMDVLEQSMSALGAAHAAGVIHRDLKPANLFVSVLPDGSWHLTVLDFGLAKRVGNKRKTMTNVVMGTPGFMAPEQIRGKAVGPPCDLYSMGVVAWVLLTGQEPFSAESIIDLMHAHLAEPLPPLAPLVPLGTPAALIALVNQLLEKSPEARPQSALKVLAELQRIRKGRGGGAQPLLTRNPARSGGGLIPAGMPTGELNDALAGTRVRGSPSPDDQAAPPAPRAAPPARAPEPDRVERSVAPPAATEDGAQTTEERPILVGQRPASPAAPAPTLVLEKRESAPRSKSPARWIAVGAGLALVAALGWWLSQPPPPTETERTPPAAPVEPARVPPVAEVAPTPPPVAEVAPTPPPAPTATSDDAEPLHPLTAPPVAVKDDSPREETPEVKAPIGEARPPRDPSNTARPKRADPPPDRRKRLATRLIQLEKRFSAEAARGSSVELEKVEVRALRERLGAGLTDRELDAVEASTRRLESWQP